MLEYFISASNMQKGLFVMLVGILGVFLVLVIFFFLIKVLQKVFPFKKENFQEDE